MGDDNVVQTIKVYYCTEHGKVMGNLQISQSRMFFDPIARCEENKAFTNLRQFEVCIDMGDVISVQKKKFINQSGSYVQNREGRKSYMFDFFLQVDLTAVNRKTNFAEVPEVVSDDDEENKNSSLKVSNA